jgi:hypothetical protein
MIRQPYRFIDLVWLDRHLEHPGQADLAPGAQALLVQQDTVVDLHRDMVVVKPALERNRADPHVAPPVQSRPPLCLHPPRGLDKEVHSNAGQIWLVPRE